MKPTNTTSVILPLHTWNEDIAKLFANAIESIRVQQVLPDKLVIVVPEESSVKKVLMEYDFGSLKDITTIIFNVKEMDFCTQVNLGIQSINTEWFSILEVDDEYANFWFKNVKIYQEAYPEVGIFMPIIVDTDDQNRLVGFTNVAPWANSFSDELGILDNNALLAHPNFNTSGMVMKKSLVEEFGGFKSNIKLMFVYEFLLRMTYNDVKTMIIPRYGYKHMNQREGSLFKELQSTIDPVEAKWWTDKAKKEYYFSKDRVINYEVSK